MQRLAALDGRWRSAAHLVCGAILSLIHPMASFPLAMVVVLPLVFAFFSTTLSPRRAAFDGWLLGFGYFMPGLLWIGSAFFVEAEKFAWMTPFAVTLLPAALAAYWAAAFALAAVVVRVVARRVGEADLLTKLLALALFWSLAEYVRGHAFTGFPWGLFAYGLIDTPIAQMAAHVGPYGLNALVLTALLGLGAAVAAVGRARWAFGGASVALLLALAVLGALRLPDGSAPLSGQVARIVQPNVPQVEKWRPDLINRNMRWLLELSEAPVDPAAAPDFVIWPETAVVPQVLQRRDLLTQVMARLPGSAPLVLGTQRPEERAGGRLDWYNSLFVVAESGEILSVYDKHHLVPFGEYLPLQDLLESIGVHQLAGRSGGFSSGPGPQVVSAPGLPRFAALICYEAVFPGAIPTGAERPDVLIQITNDAWFGDSGGPWQHLVQARYRAIEQGLPFLRSANTGVSGAIDPFGRVTASLSLGERSYLDVAVSAPLPPTLYVQYWDSFFWALVGTFGLFLVTRSLAPRL